MAIEGLPIPSFKGLSLEVQFRRLLASCEDIVRGNMRVERMDMRQWQASPVFHHYVETMEDMLVDLEESSKMSAEVLEMYRDRVRSISSALQRPELPEICRIIDAAVLCEEKKGESELVHINDRLFSTDLSSPMTRSFEEEEEEEVPDTGKRLNSSNAAVGLETPAAIQPIPLSQETKSRIENDKRFQETLTDELASMVAALKENTVNMEGKVKERGNLLETTEDALDKSLSETKKSAKKAEIARKRGRWNICLSIFVMFAIAMGLVGMYVFIRVTSFAGYRRHASVKPVVSTDSSLQSRVAEGNADAGGVGDDYMHEEL